VHLSFEKYRLITSQIGKANKRTVHRRGKSTVKSFRPVNCSNEAKINKQHNTILRETNAEAFGMG
jgi:hypothetical protein